MQFTVTLPTTLAMFGLHQPLVFCTMSDCGCCAAMITSEMSSELNIYLLSCLGFFAGGFCTSVLPVL